MPHYMGMYGTLRHYDLPDLAAAALCNGDACVPLLVASPRDELREPISDAGAARAAYAVTADAFARTGARHKNNKKNKN